MPTRPTLIDVQYWNLQDQPQPVERCEHGRPIEGSPCIECPCPVRSLGKQGQRGHSFSTVYRLGSKSALGQCQYCEAKGPGVTPYPSLSISVREQIVALARQAEEQESTE